jgi:ribonuclease HI
LADGSEQYQAADVEPGLHGQRLELLTVVRALESLDQPSQVTLVGCSEYIRNGMQYGLPEWQTNGWRWECFGQMVPVKNGDLWQRMERALRFHHVECCRRRFDPPHGRFGGENARADGLAGESQGAWGSGVGLLYWVKYRTSVLRAIGQRIAAAWRAVWRTGSVRFRFGQPEM